MRPVGAPLTLRPGRLSPVGGQLLLVMHRVAGSADAVISKAIYFCSGYVTQLITNSQVAEAIQL